MSKAVKVSLLALLLLSARSSDAHFHGSGFPIIPSLTPTSSSVSGPHGGDPGFFWGPYPWGYPFAYPYGWYYPSPYYAYRPSAFSSLRYTWP
jgi:hypothetical protein